MMKECTLRTTCSKLTGVNQKVLPVLSTETLLQGVIPCQKSFGEPILFTTFLLSGRFYHRSKKDVIRLSMTTDTDVDCLNDITIRLLIVFGDCLQSAEVKSNVF